MARTPTGNVADASATSARELVKPDLILDPIHPNAKDAILDFVSSISSPDALFNGQPIKPEVIGPMVNAVIGNINEVLENSGDLSPRIQKETVKRAISIVAGNMGLNLPPAAERVDATAPVRRRVFQHASR